MKKRIPILAAICSLIEPGLGPVYLGAFKQGLAISAANFFAQIAIMLSGIYRSFYATLIAYALLLLILRLVMAGFCWYRAIRIRTIELNLFNRWYVYAIFAILPLAPRQVAPFLKDMMPQRVMHHPSASMQPCVEPDEWIVADMRYYDNHAVVPGDVIVFRSPYDPDAVFLKRCAGVAGQKIQIRDGVLFLNDKQFAPLLPIVRTTSKVLPRDFKDDRMRPAGAGNEDQYGPVTVPDSCYFMLGDHRDNSLDSRYFGFVKKQDILGKAFYIFYSDDFGRIGRTVY